MDTKYLITISEAVTVSDYNQLASSIDGVALCIGHRDSANGKLITDTSLKDHYNGLSETKTKIGYYWLTNAIDETEAQEEVEFIKETISDYRNDLPLYIVSKQSVKDKTGRADNMNKDSRTKVLQALSSNLQSNGYRTGLYLEKDYIADNINIDSLKENNSIWIIDHSETQPSLGYDFDIWEYTSTGSVTGIESSVNESKVLNKKIINWEEYDINNIKMSLNDDTFTYSNTEKEPLIVTDLIIDTDYTVKYKDNINAGIGQVIVNGIGDYYGERIFKFTIQRRSLATSVISLGSQLEDGTYNLDNLTVTIDDTILKKDVEYSLKINSVKDYDNHYYVSTISVTGIGNYTGIQQATFNTTKVVTDVNNIDFKLSESEYVYTGNEIKPSIISDLTLNTDYTVEYQDNINTGIGKVIITGIDFYSSKRILEFKIIPIELNTNNTTINVAKTEDNSDISSVSVQYRENTLVENQDYTVSISKQELNHQMIAYIDINGKGNYTGTASTAINLYVVATDINRLKFTFTKTEYEYTGSQIIPEYTLEIEDPYVLDVRTSSNTTLKPEYSETITDNIAIITGNPEEGYLHIIGSFTLKQTSGNTGAIRFYNDLNDDTKYDEFRDGDVIPSGTKYYTCKIVCIVESEENISFVLTNSAVYPYTDYTVKCENNINAGTAMIIISGVNLYDGELVREYTITPYSLINNNAVIKCDEPDENGCYDIRKLYVRASRNVFSKRLDSTEIKIDINYAIQGNYKTAHVLATGIGNYKDTLEAKLRVQKITDDPYLDDVTTLIELHKPIEVVNITIYPRYAPYSSKEKISGTYYLWDLNIKNGKIRITNQDENVVVNCQVIGWVKIKELYGDTSKFKVNDKVIVTGELFTYSDGSGDNIHRNKAIMYIVEKNKGELYPYGVAAGRNRIAIGYADYTMLSPYIEPEEYEKSTSVEDDKVNDGSE